MGCSRSLGTLNTEIELLESLLNHNNEKVRHQANLWLLSAYVKAGAKQSAGNLVDATKSSVLDREMQLNWGNELFNEFGDSEAAEEVFSNLLSSLIHNYGDVYYT